MNAAPEASLYVGDIYSVDYLGATAVGMKAILIDVCGAYTETQLPRIESLTDLERSLAELKDRAR
jgi:FMN phosphatase YigB (HAD superfamily)